MAAFVQFHDGVNQNDRGYGRFSQIVSEFPAEFRIGQCHEGMRIHIVPGEIRAIHADDADGGI